MAVIIWPLAFKLFNPIFNQQRPSWWGGGGDLPVPPMNFPWNGVSPRNKDAKTVQPSVVHSLLKTPRLVVSGLTKDDTGTATAGFTVYLFDMTTGTPVCVQTTVSDSSGRYSFNVPLGVTYWAVDYKTGSPDKTGATVNTLVGTSA